MSIYKKLNKARSDFHKIQLIKSGMNKFAGYKYFELADFLIPALGVLDNNGLCAYVSFDADVATMTVADIDGEGVIKITSPMGSAALKGCHEVQNIGAVETYQRRYLWMALFEIVEHDALDSSQGAEPTITKEQGVKLVEAINKTDLFADTKSFMAIHGIKKLGDIRAADFDGYMEKLNA